MSTETALANEKLTHFKLTNASSFLRWLALGGVALSGHLSDCPMPNTLIDNETEKNEVVLSMSAGLPHFSVSYMRSWGRDTFISLKGINCLLEGLEWNDEIRFIFCKITFLPTK